MVPQSAIQLDSRSHKDFKSLTHICVNRTLKIGGTLPLSRSFASSSTGDPCDCSVYPEGTRSYCPKFTCKFARKYPISIIIRALL